jgi:hypothetical protein
MTNEYLERPAVPAPLDLPIFFRKLTTYYLLLTTYYLLLTTYYLPIFFRKLFPSTSPLLTTYYLLLTTYYLPIFFRKLTTYYLLLTTYYSLLTTCPSSSGSSSPTYYLLLTTYYLLLRKLFPSTSTLLVKAASKVDVLASA